MAQFKLSRIAIATFAIASASATAQEQTGGLEEITVTARKTSESLIDVPLAITAISAEQMTERGIRDALYDVATFTPGFTFQNQSANRNDRGFKAFTVRGMVPGTPPPTRQAASIFLDGTYVAAGNISGVTDIERVEVVKGPQSAYFGRSTFSGAINYITRNPSLTDWYGTLNAEYATFRTSDFSISAEGPVVVDKLAIRASARAYHTGGAYSNVEEPGTKLGRRDTESLSATLYAAPTDDLTLKMYATTWEDKDGPAANAAFNNTHYNCNAGAAPGATLNYICGNLDNVPESTRVQNTILNRAAYDFLRGARGPGRALLGADFYNEFGLRRRAWQIKGGFDYDIGDYTLSGNAAHDRNKWRFFSDTTFRDTRNVPNPNAATNPDLLPYFSRTALGDNDDKDYSGEVRLTSPRNEQIEWMVGTNYFYQKSSQFTHVWGTTGFVLATPININIIKTTGIFGSVSYDFAEYWTLTAEARNQWDNQFQQNLTGTNPSAEDTFETFTPRLILEYRPAEDVTIYTSYAEGSRPGQFNTVFFTLTAAEQAQLNASNITLSIPEERVKMGEVGAKGLFFDNRLRLLAAAYYGKWTDRHVANQVPILAPNGSLLRTVLLQLPGGEVKLSGFELEGTFQATDELTLEATFDLAATNIRKTFCTDCRATTGNASPVGTQLPYYPKTKGTVSATYEQPLTADLNGFIRADYIYTGRMYETESNLAWIGPASKVNLRLGIERGESRFELFGTNIFDDRTPSSLQRNTDAFNGGNGITVSLADRATFGARISTRF